mgnify:CR=1 FL=1
MAGMFAEVAEFFGYAIIMASVFGILTRGGNMFVRAVSGKEDIF